MNFGKVCTSYVLEIDDDKFRDLSDSESYATDDAAYKNGNKTLCEKLGEIDGVQDIEYNGLFGANVFLTIQSEEDTDETRQKIVKTINKHLKWCATLPKVDWVVKQRAESGNKA